MSENIDLTKILKNCPKGTKLYTTVWGEVTFKRVNNEDKIYPIYIETNEGYIPSLTKEGYYVNKIDADCVLFPSKDQRDWSKFTAPWYKKEQASSQTNERAWLYLVSDVLTWKDGIGQYLDNPEVKEIAKKLCSKYVQKLYNPSVLSNSSNTAKNEQKFDPTALKPFDKVLIKRDDDTTWVATLFSHIIKFHDKVTGNDYLESVTEYCTSSYCIPYNEDTKHLVGTMCEAPKYYRYWED